MSVRRRVGAAFAATATTAAIAGFPTTAFATEPGPTATARHQGITARGQAFMGWNQSAEPAAGGPADRVALTTPFASGSGVEGVDVSSYQRNGGLVRARPSAGSRFAYVKATEGRPTATPTSTPSTSAPTAPGCRTALTISPSRTSPAARRRRRTSWPTAAAGPRTAAPSRGSSTSSTTPTGPPATACPRTIDGQLDPLLHQPLPPAHRPRRGDLHDAGVVAAVHRQLHRVPPHQPAVGGHEHVGSARSRAAGRTRRSGSTPRPVAWTVTASTAASAT